MAPPDKEVRMNRHRFSSFIIVILSFCSFVFDPGSLAAATVHFTPEVTKRSPEENAVRKAYSVCPPFFLRDESGAVIDPIHGLNVDKPYSPEKTCGVCHDYKRITSAFHFQQGRGEKVPLWQKVRYPWVSSPGQYGGRW